MGNTKTSITLGAYRHPHMNVAKRKLRVRIRSGDALSTIARRYRVSVRSLMRWNHLKNKHQIRAGKKLVIWIEPPYHRHRLKYYTVRPGDSLSRIAKRHHVSIRHLRQWNNLRRKNFLHPKQRLIVHV